MAKTQCASFFFFSSVFKSAFLVIYLNASSHTFSGGPRQLHGWTALLAWGNFLVGYRVHRPSNLCSHVEPSRVFEFA